MYVKHGFKTQEIFPVYNKTVDTNTVWLSQNTKTFTSVSKNTFVKSTSSLQQYLYGNMGSLRKFGPRDPSRRSEIYARMASVQAHLPPRESPDIYYNPVKLLALLLQPGC
jgi:hypothetical protein